MPLKTKAFTILLLWIGIGLSAYFCVENTIVRIILAVIAIGVTIHIICIRARRRKSD